MKYILPVLLGRKTRTIDAECKRELVFRSFKIPKGKKLVIINVPDNFILKVDKNCVIEGTVSFVQIGKTEKDLTPVPREKIQVYKMPS